MSLNKKRATIVTLYDQKNYGNRLQNYAVRNVLEMLGIEVETLSYVKKIFDLKFYMMFIFHKLTRYHFSKDPFFWKKGYHYFENFVKFNNEFIPTKWIKDIEEIKEKESDYFVLGSDQVWNAEWYSIDILKDLFLLTFCDNRKKICFSPSFGVSSLPEEWKGWFKDNLVKFHALSVREEAGVKIIKELTNRDAELLIDPTLMLDADDWLKIAKCPKHVDVDRPYVLTYFLGEKTIECEALLEELQGKKHLCIYNLRDTNQPDLYISGPREFIYLFSKAEIILTDSFHACVFSFLFQKPFLVYRRKGKDENIMSRIYTFLNRFDLQRKLVNDREYKNIFEADYKNGYEQLEKERKKVFKYLRESMNL